MSAPLRRASQIRIEPIEFVAPGIPAAMFTVVSGRPGEGKSTWANELLARVSQNAAVIASMHEDHHAATLVPRLTAAGAVMKRVFIPADPFVFPRDVPVLERRIKQMNAKLVVCDPATMHFGVNMAGQAIRTATGPLKSMLERTGCGMVFIDHLTKRPKTSAHPLQAMAGAGSGLPAAARFVYAFGRHDGDPDERILAPVKVNAVRADVSIAYEMTSALVFDYNGRPVDVGRLVLVNDASTVDASQIIAFNGGGKASEKVDSTRGAIAVEWLIGTLMWGPVLATDVADAGKDAGFSWRTLQRGGEKLGIARTRVDANGKPKSGKGSKVTWALPADHPALAMAATMAAAAPQAGGAS